MRAHEKGGEMKIKTALVVVISGAVIIIAGIVVAIEVPASTTYQTKSAPIIHNRTITAEAVWHSKNGTLASNLEIYVDSSHDYFYVMSMGLQIYDLVKNDQIALVGDISETRGQTMNFFIFDGVGFTNWQYGRPYVAYYEADNVVSQAFAFNANQSQMTREIDFVVQKTAPSEVDVDAMLNLSASWIQSDMFYVPGQQSTIAPKLSNPTKDIVLNGQAIGKTAQLFDFYISYSDENGQDGGTAYEIKNVTETSFSVNLTLDQTSSKRFLFMVENNGIDQALSVNVTASLDYSEGTVSGFATLGGISGAGIIVVGFVVLVVGVALAIVLKNKKPGIGKSGHS
jgi:hypothetical protein